jgi:fibronectin type 3 domain-containing protein
VPTATPTPTNTPTTPTATPTMTPTATATIPAATYKYDFGTGSSNLAGGYTRVTEATVYSAGGFGWVDATGLESRDRSGPDDLNRDFVMSSSAARTFKVDLPNGNYSVSITMGDNDFAHDNMMVKANGITVLPDVDTAAAAFAVNTFNVTITGGSLSLEFSDGGGSDPTWVVNAITIKTPP